MFRGSSSRSILTHFLPGQICQSNWSEDTRAGRDRSWWRGGWLPSGPPKRPAGQIPSLVLFDSDLHLQGEVATSQIVPLERCVRPWNEVGGLRADGSRPKLGRCGVFELRAQCGPGTQVTAWPALGSATAQEHTVRSCVDPWKARTPVTWGPLPGVSKALCWPLAAL